MKYIQTICIMFFLGLMVFSVVQSQTSEMDVTLTWSADTYVPLHYPGKPLPTRNSTIEVAAVISPATYDPANLIFYWFVNGQIQNGKSGYNKETFKFQLGESLLRKINVQLKIVDSNKNILAVSGFLMIQPVESEIVITPERALSKDDNGKFTVYADQEIQFAAWPYYFNIESIKELAYDWQFGSKTAQQTKKDNAHLLNLKIGNISSSILQTLRVWVKNTSAPLEKNTQELELMLKK